MGESREEMQEMCFCSRLEACVLWKEKSKRVRDRAIIARRVCRRVLCESGCKKIARAPLFPPH